MQGKPWQISKSHLARWALLYIRQSSELQVREHQGSTMYQREQVRFPKAWGWPDDLIDEIDEDLGKSGTTTVHRPGYRRMLEWIVSGKVGAIFVADLNRLCRNMRDAACLLEECKIHDVLLVVDGRVYDLRDRSDRFAVTQVLSCAEFENDGRRENLGNGRLAKAASGYAVSNPPAGYVSKKGKWRMDPDAQVRATIGTVFRAILERRSLVKAVQALVAAGVRLPRRDGPDVNWVVPDVGKLSFMARSRAYAGDYVFRKQRVDISLGRRGNGRLKERPSTPEEMIVIEDHHEPYVTREEWAEIQHILDVNAPSKVRRNLGPGPAVLQGIVRCARHRRNLMSPRLKTASNGSRYSYYCCQGDHLRGGASCVAVSGPPLERAVVEQIVIRFKPPTIEAIRETWRRARGATLDEQQRRSLELDQLRGRVRDLGRRHAQVDPVNRHVAAALETQLEAAMRDLERAQASANQADDPLAVFTEKSFDELTSLCADFEALWNAPTTESHDRKEIVRTVIGDVTVDDVTPEQIQARIRWADRSPDHTLVVPRPAWSLRLIAELLAEGLEPEEIATRLSELGLSTRRGHPWTAKSVSRIAKRPIHRA